MLSVNMNNLYAAMNDYSKFKYSTTYKNTTSDYASIFSQYGSNNVSTSADTQKLMTDVKSIGDSLKQAANKLLDKFPPIFDQLIASTKSDAVTLKTDTKTYNTKAGSFELNVKQIAAAQKNTGSGLDASKISSVKKGNNTLSIEVDGKTTNLTVNVSATDSNKKVQQKTMDAINKAGLGLNASIQTDAKTNKTSLVIESAKTGEKNSFSIQDTNGGELVSYLGLDNQTTAAQDAIYNINNGDDKKSADNAVDFGNGVSGTLKKATTEPAKIETKRDTNKILNAVYDLVNNYNQLLEKADDNQSTKGTKNLMTQLASTAKTYKATLARVGITTDKEGYISLDKDKLTKAAEDGTLSKALGAQGSRNSGVGFLNKVEQLAKKVETNTNAYVKDSSAKSNTSFDFSSKGFSYNYISMYNNYANAGMLFDTFF